MADEKGDTVAALPALPIRVRTGPTTSFGMGRLSPGAAGAGKLRRWADITPGATPTPYPSTPTPYPSSSSGSGTLMSPGSSDLPADPVTLWEQTPTPSASGSYMGGFGFNLPGQQQALTATLTAQQAPLMPVVQQMSSTQAPMAASGSAAPQMMLGVMPANGIAQPSMMSAPVVVSNNAQQMQMNLLPQMVPQQMAVPTGAPQGMVLMMAPAPVAAVPVSAAPAPVMAADISSTTAMAPQQAAPVEPTSSATGADFGLQLLQEAINDSTYDDPQPEEIWELVRTGKLPSKGSALHPGNCQPCAWYWKKAKGCQNASNCSYCHLCPEGELKARKKAKIALMRTGALEKDEGGDPPTLRLETLIDSEQ